MGFCPESDQPLYLKQCRRSSRSLEGMPLFYCLQKIMCLCQGPVGGKNKQSSAVTSFIIWPPCWEVGGVGPREDTITGKQETS